jgi:transcriptional accessory protein Tex/SPT6
MAYNRANMPEGKTPQSFKYHIQALKNNKAVDDLWSDLPDEIRRLAPIMMSKGFKVIVRTYGDAYLATKEEVWDLSRAQTFVNSAFLGKE